MDWINKLLDGVKPEKFVSWVHGNFPDISNLFNNQSLQLIYFGLLGFVAFIIIYILFLLVRKLFRKLIQMYMRFKAFFLQKQKKRLPKENKKQRSFLWWKRLKGLFIPKTEYMKEAFYQWSKLLKQAFGDQEYMYRLPWYLVLGEAGSGKSTLLNSLNIKRPFGQGPKINSDGMPLDWHCFDYGMILDIKGDVIYDEDQKLSNDWSDILTQLIYYRPRRPLDGIILTLSAEDLYGPKKLSVLDIRKKADTLYQKLIILQNNLSMRLPIYFMITKIDLIPGFDGFIKSLQSSKLNNILGWSVPHGVHQHYSPFWMDNAFEEIFDKLHDLKLQLFTHEQPQQDLDADSVFVFIEELSKTWENISAFNHQLFANSVYKDSHFFRGIYFTGGMKFSEADQDHLNLFTHQKSWDIYFQQDVFIEKIFSERNIGFPSYEVVKSIWRHLTVGKLSLLGGLAASSLCTIGSYYQFSKSKENLLPAIQDIKNVVQEINNARQMGLEFSKEELDIYVKYFDHFMKTVTLETKFSSLFMPPSWFSSYKHDAYFALGSAFNRILVENVHHYVEQQLNQLLLKPKDEFQKDSDKLTVFDMVKKKLSEKANPIQTKYFDGLKTFAINLLSLEKIATSYNNFFIFRDQEDLFLLIKDLFNYEFNKEFKRNFKLYNWSIQTQDYDKLDLSVYKKQIQRNLEKLFDNFLVYGIRENDNLKKVFGLHSLLDELTDVESYSVIDIEDFENIFKTIQDVVDIFYRTGDLSWIVEEKFNPGEAYINLLNMLKKSQLISPKLVDQHVSRVEQAYLKLRSDIVNSYSTLLDSNVFNINGGILTANKELVNIKNYLDRFLNESFMITIEKKSPIVKGIPDKLVLWDMKYLNNGEKLLSRYYDFIEKGIEDYPEKLRPLLANIAKAKLHQNLISLLALSQYTINTGVNIIGSNPEENLKSQARNFNMTWVSLKKILAELSSVDEVSETVAELNYFIKDEFINILITLEKIIEKEDLFKISDNSFKWWTGQGNPILKGFKVSDSRKLESLLDIHFRRLSKLAKDFARPSVNLLSADFLLLQSDERLLVQQWSSILEQCLAYEKKQPGNSIENLIQLYVQDLKEFQIEHASVTLKKLQGVTRASDYFSDQRNQVIKGLSQRVDAIGGYELLANYQKLATYFNQHIANKYPFTINHHVRDEVDPQTLKDFFLLMEKLSFSFDDYSTAFKAKENNPDRYINFLKKLDTLRQLFKPFIQGKTDVPTIALQVSFNALPHKESKIAHDYLIEQYIHCGTDNFLGVNENGKKITWTYGDPINISFQLTEGKDISIFSYDQNEVSFNKKDKLNCEFSYEGGWSLFRLLVDKSDRNEKGVLQFNIPVLERQNTKLNMRTFIKINLQSSDETAPVSFGTFPVLPNKAPNISDKNLKAIRLLETSNDKLSSKGEKNDE